MSRRRVHAATARRLFELVEPIAVVTYTEDEAGDAVMRTGDLGPWDAYFAGRAAPLGVDAPAELVHALFYSFAPGEVARHVPKVWSRITPEAATAAREDGSVASLRRMLGTLADGPGVAVAGDLLLRAGTSAPIEGRGLFAALRTLPVPAEPVARLWHGANLLREHRGDGHVVALVANGIGGTEAHVLLALDLGMPAEDFGRVSHLPKAQLAAVVDGLRARGLVDDDGRFTDAGREVKARVELLTDELAAPAYDILSEDDLARLLSELEPITAAIRAAPSHWDAHGA